MHSQSVRSGLERKEPSGDSFSPQFRHSLVPMDDATVSAGHSEHWSTDSAPTREYVPAGHGLHALASFSSL